LANSPRNALVDSERAHNALNNCANTRTVKPPVRASASDASPAISPPGSIQSNVNKLANAMTSPTSITPGDLSSHAITSESPLKRQVLSQLGVGSFPHALLARCLFAHTAGTFIGFVGGPLCLACHFHCQFCLEVRLIGPQSRHCGVIFSVLQPGIQFLGLLIAATGRRGQKNAEANNRQTLFHDVLQISSGSNSQSNPVSGVTLGNNRLAYGDAGHCGLLDLTQCLSVVQA
jgi:hypothetical protein